MPQTSADQNGVAEFYKSNPITILVASDPGGGYGVYAATLARHMPKHLPGNPAMTLKFDADKGGLAIANEIATTAPRDGSVIGAIRAANTVEPVLNPRGDVAFDAREMNWIGNVSRQNGTCITWHTSSIKSIPDARQREVRVGAGSPASNVGTVANILNGLLGTKFKTVFGYVPTNFDEGFEKGDIEGIVGLGYNTLLAAHKDWIDGKKINSICHTGLEPDPLQPGVPCTIEFADNEDDRNVIRMMDFRQVMGRPYAAPPGVPADRLAAIRQAFDLTVKDPDYLSDAERNGMIVQPINHTGMKKIIASAYAMPDDVIRRTWDLLKVG